MTRAVGQSLRRFFRWGYLRQRTLPDVRLRTCLDQLLITRLLNNSGPSVSSWWSGTTSSFPNFSSVFIIHRCPILPRPPCFRHFRNQSTLSQCCFSFSSCTRTYRHTRRRPICGCHSRRRYNSELDKTRTATDIYSRYRAVEFCADKCPVRGRPDEEGQDKGHDWHISYTHRICVFE